MIDNAIDASANDIDLRLNLRANKPQEAEIVIVDNGTGMTPAEIVNSLRLGSGVKGGHRSALGRFGIGLTNAALSLGRRVEVYSWRTPRYVRMTRVDLDDVLSGLQDTVPMPVRVPWPADVEKETHKSGTMIRLCNLDRLNSRYVKPMQQNISTEFGRVYRKHLTLGLTIRVNGKPIEAIDPMFLMPGSGIRGEKYGTTLVLPIRDDRTITTAPRLRRSVSILFSELPVERSSALSNHEKRSLGISKRSGVSILRGNREIDYGWFFMGRKRKENYDDWWRCQISFFPDLDELFGVNNTKQGIRPQRELVEVLTPHIEATAYKLNRRTRQKFAALRKVTKSATSSRIATQN
ncbi:MAG: ATP-binding protein, partial [Nitrospinae bacterium]|nr:ATP-binding protein [Nitrospinota bacterium]